MFFLSFPRSAPVRKPQKKSFLFCAQGRRKTKTFQFFQKSLHLPLYKIEISGIIIIVRCASVAQSVEQGTENPRVIGSIPIGGTSQETQQGFQYAAVAHLVERHLAKVEVASSSLVGRSIGVVFITPYMVTWPSGKARVCKTLIHQFKSGRHLQKIPGSFGFRDFLFCTVPCRRPRPLSHLR